MNTAVKEMLHAFSVLEPRPREPRDYYMSLSPRDRRSVTFQYLMDHPEKFCEALNEFGITAIASAQQQQDGVVLLELLDKAMEYLHEDINEWKAQ